MDGQWSAAHRPSSLLLLDIVDHDWRCDAIAPDHLHLAESDLAAGGFEEVDPQAPSAIVMQDREGASWSLLTSVHNGLHGANAGGGPMAASGTGRGAGLTGITSTLGGASSSLAHSLAFGSHLASGPSSHLAHASAMAAHAAGGAAAGSQVESADGRRWTDLALGALAATAGKQSNRR